MVNKNNDENRTLWQSRIKDYKASGLTAIKWCEENGIPVHILRYQITKFNKEKKRESKDIQWAAAIPEKSVVLKSIVMPLKVTIGQSTIEVTPDFDTNTLKAVIRILSDQC